MYQPLNPSDLKVGDKVARARYNTGINGLFNRHVEFVTVVKVTKTSVVVANKVGEKTTFTMGNRVYGSGSDRWSSLVDELITMELATKMINDINEDKAVRTVLGRVDFNALTGAINSAKQAEKANRDTIENLKTQLRTALAALEKTE